MKTKTMSWDGINQSFDISHIYIHYVVNMISLNLSIKDESLKHKIVSLEYFRTKMVSTAYANESLWIDYKRRLNLKYPKN